MDEAIGQIDRRAKGLTRGTEGIPFGAAKDLVDEHARFMPKAAPAVKQGLSADGRSRWAYRVKTCPCQRI